MKIIKLLAFLLVISSTVFGQQRKVELIEADQWKSNSNSFEIELPKFYESISFTTIAFESEQPVEILIQIGDQPKRKLNKFSHQEKTDKNWISELLYVSPNEKVIVTSNYEHKKYVKVHFYQEPINSNQAGQQNTTVSKSSQACPCPNQSIWIGRDGVQVEIVLSILIHN